MPKHYKYGSSAMARIMKCPGSADHLIKYPLPQTEYTESGTDSHSVGERMLKGEDPFDIDCTEDEFEFAEGYVAAVEEAKSVVVRWVGEKELIEEQVATTVLVGDVEVPIGGTPDYQYYNDDTIITIDAKHGFQYVDEKNNIQCLNNTMALIDEKGLKPKRIIHHIYQPNGLGKAHRWVEVDPMDIEEYRFDAAVAIEEAEKPNAPKVYGASQCEFCNKSMCSKFREEGGELGLTVVGERSGLPDLNKMDTEQLLKVIDYGPLVVKAIKEANKIIMARAMEGHEIPDRKLVKSYGNREWIGNPDGDAVLKMADTLELPVPAFFGEMPVKGPAPIEKLIKAATKGKENKAKREELLALFNDLVDTPEKGVKLVHSGHKAEAITAVFTEEDDEPQ